MRLHECLANLVGKLILGKKLFVHIKSRKSPNFSRSEICNQFILKSPTIAAYVFSRWIISIIGESSDINCCIFALLLLSWGGRYMLPIVNVRQRLPPSMSINKPSQMLELVNKFPIQCKVAGQKPVCVYPVYVRACLKWYIHLCTYVRMYLACMH